MTVTIEAAPFAQAMKYASQIIESRNTIPILSNVLIRVSEGAMRIVMSDLDVWLDQSIPCEGEIEFTAEASKLAAIAQACEAPLTFTLAERVTIKSGRSRWVLPIISAKDFPVMPADGLCAPVEFADIAAPVARVMPCISDSAVHASRAGIFLDDEGGKLRMVTLDESRAIVVTTDAKWPDAETAIVPKKFARIMMSLKGAVSLEWGDGKVRATAGNSILTGKLLDGQFPDYRRVVPRTDADPVSFDPDQLRSAVRRVTITEETKTRIVRLSASDGVLVAEIGSASGEGRDELPVSGDLEMVGFNSQFLSEMLESIGGETIDMHVVGRAALIRRRVDDGSFGILGTCLV